MSDAGVLAGALFLSILHSVIPNHWAPFVIVGRLRNWSRARLATITFVAGFLHAGVTMAIGLAVAYAGHAAGEDRIHSLRSVAALILIMLGAALILGRVFGRHLHAHFEPARWSSATDAVLISALIGMLSISPCAEILPLYLLAAADSWRLVILLSAVVVLATSAGMTFIVLAAGDRFAKIKLGFIEENEGAMAGVLLIALGALAAGAGDGLMPGARVVVGFAAAMSVGAWRIFLDAAPYILFGCLAGGVVYAFIRPHRVSKYLGSGRFKPVVNAALIGVPLPLCSCGVIPTALTLRRLGATRGATTAFLITTPETGVDSIAVTYALMDPIYTVFRPVAAFVMGVIAGVAETIFGEKETRNEGGDGCPSCAPGPANASASGRADSAPADPSPESPFGKLRTAITYGLGDFLDDISAWLVIGFLAAGLILTAIPAGAIERTLGGGLPGMLIVLIVSVPLYICASATTPMAAALLVQGASPGAALVLLLAGPATNTAGIILLTRFLGKRAVAIYLLSITICSLVFGLLLNALYQSLGISPGVSIEAHHMDPGGPFKQACAVILAALVAFHLVRRAIQKIGRGESHEDHTSHSG